MAKVLRLYNSYTRRITEARLAGGQVIQASKFSESGPKHGSLYICGPTVYSDSHLGHAITYVRADLFRKVLKSIFGIRLSTVMNITDIDDKILAKVNERTPNDLSNLNQDPSCHPFNEVSEKYYKSFKDDMDYINVAPPDMTIKVTRQINLIINYIRQLEKNGHAYIASNGDVYFSVSSLANYEGRIDARHGGRMESDDIKRDVRDFAMWKAAKPNEPVWHYESIRTGQISPGRPGWHVQCSAISSAIFGNQLDFHFGGKDLIFPHHYNEQACCCAYHKLDTSKDFHVWSANWLHSGHLVLRDEKMSKSLGNVVGIRSFINENSINALRLICIASHYRADVNFDGDLLHNMRSLDHKLSAFVSYINSALIHLNNAHLDEHAVRDTPADIENASDEVWHDIIDGVCDDLDLSRGLQSILELSKKVYNIGYTHLKPTEIVAVWHLLVDWLDMCGLDYGTTKANSNEQTLIDMVKDFRNDTRHLVIDQLRSKRSRRNADRDVTTEDEFLNELLAKCDEVRAKMDELGFVTRDDKT